MGIIKTVKQSIGSAIKAGMDKVVYGIPGAGKAFVGTSVAGLGVAATLGGMTSSLNNQRNKFRQEENPYSPEHFKNQTFWQRQSTVASVGMMGNLASARGVGNPVGGFKSLWDYNTQRAADIYMTSGLPGGTKGPGGISRKGMVAGGALGAAVGIAAGAFTRLPMTKTVLSLSALGAVGGGYQARKVSLQVMESFNTARKSSINRNKVANRTRTQGSGFRSWSRGNRMGRPGHLGMSGTTPFAMHKARHRSTV